MNPSLDRGYDDGDYCVIRQGNKGKVCRINIVGAQQSLEHTGREFGPGQRWNDELFEDYPEGETRVPRDECPSETEFVGPVED